MELCDFAFFSAVALVGAAYAQTKVIFLF